MVDFEREGGNHNTYREVYDSVKDKIASKDFVSAGIEIGNLVVALESDLGLSSNSSNREFYSWCVALGKSMSESLERDQAPNPDALSYFEDYFYHLVG